MVSFPGKGKEMANPIIKLRKQKSQSTSRNGSPAIGARSLSTCNPLPLCVPSKRLCQLYPESPDPTTTPPVFWTEVFSRADLRWLPVDPTRGIVNNRHLFDPSHLQNTGASKTSIRQDNRMLYVIGLEEDSFGRDITARYAREYTAKVSKVQAVGAGPAGGRKEWWATVVQSITRPYRLVSITRPPWIDGNERVLIVSSSQQRDDLEDDELHTHQLTEGMPTTMTGFKNHPLCVHTVFSGVSLSSRVFLGTPWLVILDATKLLILPRSLASSEGSLYIPVRL